MERVRNPFGLPFQHVVQQAKHRVRLSERAERNLVRRQRLHEEVDLDVQQACSFLVRALLAQYGGNSARVDRGHLQHAKSIAQCRASEFIRPQESNLFPTGEILLEREHIPPLDVFMAIAHSHSPAPESARSRSVTRSISSWLPSFLYRAGK